MYSSLDDLRKDVVVCRRCPRLVEFRENVPVRKAFQNDCYWRRPVPGFGDPDAWLLLTGLAPAAQGGNRTGRLFTGDKSSEFLIKGLYEVGLANQPESISIDDGLVLHGCYMTAVVKCVPPHDKPLRQEIVNCSVYYQNELLLLKRVKYVLALGRLAFDAFCMEAKLQGRIMRLPKFAHGHKYEFEGMPVLYACYHPSPQNTNTGKLTECMFRDLLYEIISESRL